MVVSLLRSMSDVSPIWACKHLFVLRVNNSYTYIENLWCKLLNGVSVYLFLCVWEHDRNLEMKKRRFYTWSEKSSAVPQCWWLYVFCEHVWVCACMRVIQRVLMSMHIHKSVPAHLSMQAVVEVLVVGMTQTWAEQLWQLQSSRGSSSSEVGSGAPTIHTLWKW